MGATALHWAYFSGSRAIVDLVLRAGADATNRENPMRCTPRAFGLCAPAHWGWLSKVRQRLGDDPSLIDIMEGRDTPLHEAAREGHIGVVKVLVEAGADLGRRTVDGKTALELARERPGHTDCVAVAAWLAAASAVTAPSAPPS